MLLVWCNRKESRYLVSKKFRLKGCKVVLVTMWGKKAQTTVFFLV